jgi:hypothetical protein
MWLIAWILGAILNSVMDSLYSEHIGETDFAKKNPSFWNKDISAHKAKMIGKYRLDAWHICKSLMILMMCASMLFYYYLPWYHLEILWIDVIKDVIIAGLAWNIPFNTFYNRIWKK